MSSWTTTPPGRCSLCHEELCAHVRQTGPDEGKWSQAYCKEHEYNVSWEGEGKRHAHPSMTTADCVPIAPIEEWWPTPKDEPRWPFGRG